MENVQTVARGHETDAKKFYKIVKDGNGTEIKIIDLDNPEVCKRSGLVELVPLREKKNTQGVVIHHSRVMFRRSIDQVTKASIGITDGIDPKTKELRFRMITLEGRRVYDLTNLNDAQEWACIKYSPYLEGSPNQDRNTPPMYKVYDKEKQAEENIKKYKTKREAQRVAETLSGSLLDNMLMARGINVAGLSEVSKQYAIIKDAEDHPDEFLNEFNSPTRAEAFLLKQAIEADVVQNDLAIGFMYKTILLGVNEQLAIQYLVDHPNISTAIQTLVDMKNNETVKANSVEPKVVNSDSDLIAANNRIKELEAALLKKNQDAAEAEVGQSLDGSAPDPEFETLKAEAKHLKVPKWHVMGKEKLKAAVEKAKNN